LAHLIDDPAARMALGKKGRRWVEEHRTWSMVGERFAQGLRSASVPPTALPPAHDSHLAVLS